MRKTIRDRKMRLKGLNAKNDERKNVLESALVKKSARKNVWKRFCFGFCFWHAIDENPGMEISVFQLKIPGISISRNWDLPSWDGISHPIATFAPVIVFVKIYFRKKRNASARRRTKREIRTRNGAKRHVTTVSALRPADATTERDPPAAAEMTANDPAPGTNTTF